MSDAPREVERTRFEPPVTETSQPFWDATRERRLVLQWCTECDVAVAHGNGGVLSSQCTVLLGDETTA